MSPRASPRPVGGSKYSHVSSKLDHETAAHLRGKYDKKRIEDIEATRKREKAFAHGPSEGFDGRPRAVSPSRRYKDVSSKYNNETNAFKCGKYTGPPNVATPGSPRGHAGSAGEEKPFIVGVIHSQEEIYPPTPPVVHPKKYQEVSSRLHEPTTATRGHKYDENHVVEVSPLDVPLVPVEKSKKYADIQSRLFELTENIKNQKYDESRKEKLKESKVKNFAAGTSAGVLDNSPKPVEKMDKYGDIKSRLLEPTAAVINGSYDEDRAKTVKNAAKYKSFSVRPSDSSLDHAPKKFEKTDKYSDIKSKLHEATAAVIHGRADPATATQREQNVLWRGGASSNPLDSMTDLPPAPSNEYWKTRASSRLMDPTVGSIMATANWSETLNGGGSPSVRSRSPGPKPFAAGGVSKEVLDQAPRAVTPTKSFDHITSRLSASTVASEACQYDGADMEMRNSEDNGRWRSSTHGTLDDHPLRPITPTRRYSHVQPRLHEETSASIYQQYDATSRDSLRDSVGSTDSTWNSSKKADDAASVNLPNSPLRWQAQTRLHDPTAATINGAYSAPVSAESSRSVTPTRRWSMKGSQGVFNPLAKPLGVNSKGYDTVASRLHQSTSATERGRYDFETPMHDDFTGRPDRLSAKSGLYEHVGSRLQNSTHATRRGSTVKRADSRDGSVTSEMREWISNSRQAKLELFTLSENPSPRSKKYAHVSSKLHSPTKATIHGRHSGPSRRDAKRAVDDMGNFLFNRRISAADRAEFAYENPAWGSSLNASPRGHVRAHSSRF